MSKEISISEGTKAIIQTVDTQEPFRQEGSGVLHGRVVAICLSPSDPLFNTTNTLESIQFEPVVDVSVDRTSGDKTQTYLIAYKHDPSIRTPLINEIVTLTPAPSIGVQNVNTQFAKSYYYGNPISIYGAVEHNAAPDDNTLASLVPSNNKLSSYNNASTGINNNTNGTDTIVKDDTLRLGSYFTEQGVKQLTPLEGDHKVEGRFGNSIRFGGSPSSDISQNTLWSGPVGSPITIIRNGAAKTSPGANIPSVFEDINKDGSSVYFLSSQSIELVLACDNFDTYGITNNNSAVSSQVIVSAAKTQPTGSSLADDSTFTPTETPILPVSPSSLDGDTDVPSNDTDAIPDNEDDLNYVQIGIDIPVPLTQGTLLNNYDSSYVFTPGTNSSSTTNSSLVKGPKLSLSTNNAISNYAGTVSSVPSITKNGKALLDLISITEGTIGQGHFNGYDIMIGGTLIPGFTSYTSAPPHPNIAIKTEYPKPSTASGRYQFVINTWNLVMGAGTTMTKFNQDYACWKNILNSASVPSILISKIDTDQNAFNMVINMLANQWSSLPVTNDPKGLYKQAGKYSFATLYAYYQQILAKY